MKSITIRIDGDLLEAIDARVGPENPRSRVIRNLLREAIQPSVIPPPSVPKPPVKTVDKVEVKVEAPVNPRIAARLPSLVRNDVTPIPK